MIKFYSGQYLPSLPLSGTVGALKDIIKACGCDGIGSKTPSSVVITSGVAVFTVSGGHTFYKGAVAGITGVTVTGGPLNGERRVLDTSTNTISVDATGIANQAATLSTPTIKIASLGWTEMFPGTANKFAAKSAQMDSTGMIFRLDDAWTSPKGALVRGYESMSDIDTGVGPFPSEAQVLGGGFRWKKSNAADANPRAWTLVGDEYSFYISFGPQVVPSSGVSRDCFFFGDLKAVQAGDPYSCVIAGSIEDDYVNNSNTTSGSLSVSNGGQSNNTVVVARQFSGAGGPGRVRPVAAGRLYFDNVDTRSGGDQYSPSYPTNPGNLLLVSPVLAFEYNSTWNIRGTFPGLYHVTQNLNGGFGSDEIIPGSGVYAGREFLSVVGGVANGAWTGSILFDLSGPWR